LYEGLSEMKCITPVGPLLNRVDAMTMK
jgi:hypothetical protein